MKYILRQHSSTLKLSNTCRNKSHLFNTTINYLFFEQSPLNQTRLIPKLHNTDPNNLTSSPFPSLASYILTIFNNNCSLHCFCLSFFVRYFQECHNLCVQVEMPRWDNDFWEQTHHCTWTPFQRLAKENEYEKQSRRLKSCSLLDGIPVFETPCQALNNVTSGKGTNYTIWIKNTKTAWWSIDYLRFLTSHEPPHASRIPITLTITQGKRCWNKTNITCCHQEVIIDSWMIDIMYSAC